MSNPMDSLNYFRLSGLFCDIKLWAKKPNGPLYQMQGGPYQAHRVIISASSPVLCRTLTTGEGKDKDNISIPVRNPAALEIVLLWIYGQVSEVLERIQRHPEVVNVASDLANSLEVDSLVEYLQQCSGNQFEDEFFPSDQPPDSSFVEVSGGHFSDSRVEVQWDQSWEERRDEDVDAAPAAPTPAVGHSSTNPNSSHSPAPVNSLPWARPLSPEPKNPPFLAKITTVGRTVRVLCTKCGLDKSIVYKTKYTLKAHMKNAHNKSLDFFNESTEVLVYNKEEYLVEAKEIEDKISEKRRLSEKILAGEIVSKPLVTIGKDVKVLCPKCKRKPDSSIFKSKQTLKIHMSHHHNFTLDLKDEKLEVPVVDEEEWLREFEISKLRVAGAADRVHRLREILRQVEEDPMSLVPEEEEAEGERKEEKEAEKGDEAGEKRGGRRKKVYENQPLLIPYDLVHGGSVRVFCAICNKEYINRYLLKSHFKTSHPEWFEEIEKNPSTRILVVDKEEFRQSAQKEVDSGAASVHFKPKLKAKIEISKKLGLSPPPPPKSYACQICPRNFSMTRALKRHIEREHPFASRREDGDDEASAASVPARPPRHPESVNPKQDASIRTCTICNQEFADRVYYRKHMKTKHNLTAATFRRRKRGRPRNLSLTVTAPAPLTAPLTATIGSVKSLADDSAGQINDDRLFVAEDRDDGDDGGDGGQGFEDDEISNDDLADEMNYEAIEHSEVVEDELVDDYNYENSYHYDESTPNDGTFDFYEDSQIEYEETEIDHVDEMGEINGTSDMAEPLGVPLLYVPYNELPTTVRMFCHFESCRWKLCSKMALKMHLASVHSYIVDESTYVCQIEENELHLEMLRRVAENRKYDEERAKWQKFLAEHESLITIQEICTYCVHNEILKPTDPILSIYPMVPYRFIPALYKKVACPICGDSGLTKYLIHKHIFTTHSIDVDVPEIKPDRGWKRRRPVYGKKKNNIADMIRAKERRDTLAKYRNQQKLDRLSKKSPSRRETKSDVSPEQGSHVSQRRQGRRPRMEKEVEPVEEVFSEDNDAVVCTTDDGAGSYTNGTFSVETENGELAPEDLTMGELTAEDFENPSGYDVRNDDGDSEYVGKSLSDKKKKRSKMIPVPDDLTAVPFEEVSSYNIQVVCHVCYRVICNKSYLKKHLQTRHSQKIDNFATLPILLFKDDAKELKVKY